MVEHKPDVCKFILPLEGGEEAFISYKIESIDIWDAYHTEVPTSQRGRGLGGVLAEAIFQHAQKNNIKLRLTCTYLAHYLTKHPEYVEMTVPQ